VTVGRIVQAIFGSVILLEILSVSTCDSWIPWALLEHRSLGLRVLGWILIVQVGMGLLGLLAMQAVPDKPCPICARDLKAFIPVYGPPRFCPRCRSAFHTLCLRSKPRCPVCYPEVDSDEDDILLDFTRRSGIG